MNLGEFRELFITRSGRFDLVVDDTNFEDNGANQFINEAQRYLDRKLNVTHSDARLFKEINVNDIGITFNDCRIIKEVWCFDTTNRWWVEKVDYPYLRSKPDLDSLVNTLGYSGSFSSLDTSAPLNYAPARLRVTPESSSLPLSDLDLILSYGDVMLGDYKTYNGIIFLPPSDGSYVVEIFGSFYAPKLSSDSDNSIWSEEFSDLLLMATMRQLEIFYRNTEGVKDWNNVISEELINIDFDIVEQESVDVNQLEG